jgi:cold shock CspA family protein
MEIKGKLVRWNDERGFGFIQSDELDKDLFVHISALKNASRKPKVGDTLYFIIATDKEGKDRAHNARIDGVPAKVLQKQINYASSQVNSHSNKYAKPAHNQRRNHGRTERKRGSAIPVLVIVLALFAAYKYVTQAKPVVHTPIVHTPIVQKPVVQIDVVKNPVRHRTITTPAPVKRENFSSYSCQGKQHCNQMSSCKEARFYLKNCPNVKIDGDGDGIPCERMCR